MLYRESDNGVVPVMPGNAGRGKAIAIVTAFKGKYTSCPVMRKV
jgi:hypothetical protein